MLKRSLIFPLVLILTWGCSPKAQQVAVRDIPEEKESKIKSLKIDPLPKGVSIHQLDNGMEVLLIENQGIPMVGVNVVVKVGSAYETFATSGMSHMLEHLLFNGTTTRTQKQLYDDVDLIGGYNNANTAEYYTNYMMVTPAEQIQKGMEIQADMLFNSILPEEKFEKEKGIVLEEIARSLGNSNEQLERNIISILYQGHALSLPTLGTYSTIESMCRDNVYDFYKNNYVPNNMLISAVGSFQSDSMLAWIKKIYGTAAPGEIRRSEMPGWSTGFQHPKRMFTTPGEIFHRFYDGQESKVQFFYRLASRFRDETYLELLDIFLDKQIDSLQSILIKSFPEQVKSLEISTRPSVLADFLQVTITLNKEEDLEVLANTVHQQILALKFSLPSEEVKTIAVKKNTDFLKNIEKPHMFGIYNAHKFAIGGIESVLQSYSKEPYEMAAKQVEQLRLPQSPVVIVQHSTAMIRSSELASKEQKKLFENGNGRPNVIAVQNSLSDLLAIHYLVMHKAKYESTYGKDAAKILHDCFEQRLTSPENKKMSEQFGFTYTVNDNPFIPMDNIYLHPDFGYIRVEGLAEDLPGAIQFLNNNMTGFIPTEEEFQNAQKKLQRTSYMAGTQPAQKIFEDTYKSIIYEPEKYPESESSVTYESLSAFAKEYFQSFNMIISVVSPAPAEEINHLFSNFTSHMKNNSTISEEAWDYTLRSLSEPKSVEKEGGGEQSYLFWGFISQIDPNDKPALQALSLILADRIIFDIREKQGLAYRMSAGIDLVKNKALFYIRMGTRPQNVDKLVPQYPEFFNIDQLKTLDATELEKSVNMYLGRMMFRRLSSINKAYYLAHSNYFHNDINYDNNFFQQLKMVSVEDVKEVALKYMAVKNPIQVIVR